MSQALIGYGQAWTVEAASHGAAPGGRRVKVNAKDKIPDMGIELTQQQLLAQHVSSTQQAPQH